VEPGDLSPTIRDVKLQQRLGTNAEVLIENGDSPKLLNQIAEQIAADTLTGNHAVAVSFLDDHGLPPVPKLHELHDQVGARSAFAGR
jgi:hypothetical protein